MFPPQILDEFAILAGRAAENVGAMLCKWVQCEVRITASTVDIVGIERIPEIAGDIDEIGATVTLLSRVEGELPGITAMQIGYADATSLVRCLGGNLPPGERALEIGEMERSMLQETANVLFSAMMNSLASNLGLRAIPFAPSVVIDHSSAVWGGILLEFADEADEAVVVTVSLECMAPGPRLRLIFLPLPSAMAVVQQGLTHAQ